MLQICNCQLSYACDTLKILDRYRSVYNKPTIPLFAHGLFPVRSLVRGFVVAAPLVDGAVASLRFHKIVTALVSILAYFVSYLFRIVGVY